jgi:predicted enzyme related to lactoylglutathione lyase
MKTSILGLRTTIYQVGDITAAKAWYSDIFQSEPYFDEPFYVGFNIGGYELGLQPEEVPTTDKKASVLTYWGVEDIAAEFDRFISLGAVADEAPNNVGGEILVATVKDPWGNLIGLIYNPHFKLDA